MAHEIDMSNGIGACMVAGDPAWHGLGVNVEEAVTSGAAIKLAGLDWTVERRCLFYTPSDPESVETFDVPGKVALVRSDNNELLSIRSKSYVPLQNVEAFDFMDALVDQGEVESVKYQTAGALKGGRVVWMLAKLPGEVRVGEHDVSYPYLLLSNSHDGTQAVRIMPTMVRVVCNNTLNLAIRRKGMAPEFTMWHTPGLKGKRAEAKRVLGLASASVKVYGQKAAALAKVEVSRQRRQQFAADLFPIEDDATDRQKDNAMGKRKELQRLFEDEPANTLPGIEGTGWALLNAATHMVDHGLYAAEDGEDEKGRNEGRLSSIWYGKGAKLKAMAMV